ncbi:uncharacterized protein LOC143635772 [Bidens hawaiensis]|uniref:uncharacterized protein LOC143635772 n=1 Tax=Bidens hawaiensis TaxID=980011 RepID=UPI004049B748
MLGSLDCTHWPWEACPIAWQGKYHRGDHDGPTIMLEAVASFDLWIWHAFFGMLGANNDIAVIHPSPIFDRVIEGVAPDTSFSTNDVNYEYRYYLVDGMCPSDDKHQYFRKKHESTRKDIERAFEALNKRWSIIRQPTCFHQMNKLRNIMRTCIILLNMILDDSGKAICQGEYNDEPEPIYACTT